MPPKLRSHEAKNRISKKKKRIQHASKTRHNLYQRHKLDEFLEDFSSPRNNLELDLELFHSPSKFPPRSPKIHENRLSKNESGNRSKLALAFEEEDSLDNYRIFSSIESNKVAVRSLTSDGKDGFVSAMIYSPVVDYVAGSTFEQSGNWNLNQQN